MRHGSIGKTGFLLGRLAVVGVSANIVMVQRLHLVTLMAEITVVVEDF